MNIPLLTTPLSCRPVSLSFGIAKIEFFYYIQPMQRIFLNFFLNVFILLIISILFWRLGWLFRIFSPFSLLFAIQIPENFADFRQIAAKIENRPHETDVFLV